MDRILRHLEYVPIDLILLFAALAGAVVILFPKKYGMEAALLVSSAWLNMNRFNSLADVASLAKVTYWAPLLALIFFATTRPGPRRKVPALAWIYLIVPLLGCICVLSAIDAAYGILQFFNMFLTAAAAIAVYRVVDSGQMLYRIIQLIFIGLLIPVGVSLAALIFFRSQSFVPGTWRFMPFGIGPNQLVPILATAICFAGCGFTISKSNVMRMVSLGAIGTSVALLLATGSRQGVIVTGMAVLPLALWSIRRPFLLTIALGCGIPVAIWTFAFTEGIAATDRLLDYSHTSNRYSTAMQYLDTFSHRPSGLLGTTGDSVRMDDSATRIPHNSYLGMLYIGGVLLGVPLFIAMIYTLYSIWRVMVRRREVNINPLLLWSLGALLLAIYMHGLVSDMAYLSISTWSFLHFFLSCLFMGLAKEFRQFKLAAYSRASSAARAYPTS